MGVRQAIRERVGMGIEEVIRRGDHFVPKHRVKVSEADGQIVVRQVDIRLGQGKTVLFVIVIAGAGDELAGAAGKRGISGGFQAGGLREAAVGAVHGVDPPAVVHAAALGVDVLLDEHVELVDLRGVVQVVEFHRSVGAVDGIGAVEGDAGVHPAAHRPAVLFQDTELGQFPPLIGLGRRRRGGRCGRLLGRRGRGSGRVRDRGEIGVVLVGRGTGGRRLRRPLGESG